MIAALREWLVSVICAAVAVAVAESMALEGSMKKIVSMTGGLILLVLLLRPLGGMEPDLFLPEYGTYNREIQQRQEELEAENIRQLQTIIERETAAYILDKAAELGVDCRVTVHCRADEAGVPRPYSVTVNGPVSEELENWIEGVLNIPKERQVFHGTEE